MSHLNPSLVSSAVINFAANGVEFSPFRPDLLAVCSSQYFSLVGNGKLSILRISSNEQSNLGMNLPIQSKTTLNIMREFITLEGLNDCRWSEIIPEQLIAGSADGSLKLFDIRSSDNFPLCMWKDHGKDISSVDWNIISPNRILSSSWDGCVKVYDPSFIQAPLKTYNLSTVGISDYLMKQKSPLNGQIPIVTSDKACSVYAARFHPNEPDKIVVGDSHGMINIIDTKAPRGVIMTINSHMPSSSLAPFLKNGNSIENSYIGTSEGRALNLDANHYLLEQNTPDIIRQSIYGSISAPTVSLNPSPISEPNLTSFKPEILAVEWDKYNNHCIYSGGTDNALSTWDLRMPYCPISRISGAHGKPILRLRSCPFHTNIVASVSYDMTAALWNTAKSIKENNGFLGNTSASLARINLHREFVKGVDFSVLQDGLLATCGWDRAVAIWKYK